MESVSLNLDLDNNEDEDEFEDRQKEIQGLLSSAFDDLSSLSEDEEEYNQFSVDCNNGYQRSESNDYRKRLNGLTSTPLLTNRDIIEDEEEVNEEHSVVRDGNDADNEDNEDNDIDHQFCVQNQKTDEQFDSKGSLENGRTEQSVPSMQTKPVCGPKERSFSERHVQLLIEENQRLSNELIVSQQKLSAINGNYDGLQYKLKELDQINTEKENQLIRLEGKIKSLELNIKVERESKEELQRKLSVSEATIESLQYQLMEIGKSDCLIRAQESHQSVVNCLKAKHENEILLRNEEMEELRQQLMSKNNEILSINEEFNRLRLETNENYFSDQMKEMLKVTKDLWEQEMKSRVENDIKGIIEAQEKKWAKSAEQELNNERNKWENELQSEVFEIISLLKIKAKVSVGNLPQRVGLHFVPLLNLWHALEDSCDTKEQTLRTQIERLNEAKAQLEEALNESRTNRSTSPSNQHDCPPNDQIFNELRIELQKVSEEAVVMKQKLVKYKQHYKQLVKKHSQEMQRIKEEFAVILDSLKRDLK